MYTMINSPIYYKCNTTKLSLSEPEVLKENFDFTMVILDHSH